MVRVFKSTKRVDIVVRELQNREASQRISLEQFPKKNYKNRKSIQKKAPTLARAYQNGGIYSAD